MSHTVELLSVGTELLLGNIANTDAQMLSQGLSALGLNVYYHTVVGDNPQRAREAVAIAKKRADIIITTGGLGPTCDDLTKNVLADAFGKKLVFHEESAERIRSFFARTGRKMTDNNLQQAMLPEGCTVLDNDWGTAPGCAFTAEGCTVIMLPGPPRECNAMLQYRVLPYLRGQAEGVILSRTLNLFGIGESAMEAQLREEMLRMENPTLAPYAKEGSTELRITAKAESEDACRALIAPVEQALRARFGDLIYGADEGNLETAVLHLLQRADLTFAAAESCTGGLVAQRFTALPGASRHFRGGVVCYTNDAKRDLVGVDAALLDRAGAVSPEVAGALAQNIRARLRSDLAVSVTGVAGPDPDDRGNPVGLVWVGLADRAHVWVRKLQLDNLGRARNQTLAAHHAFDLLRRHLSGLELKAQQLR